MGNSLGADALQCFRRFAEIEKAAAAAARILICMHVESTCRAATIVARNATFTCAKDGEVCDDRGCKDESLLAG